jgi:hypothetical protein
VIGKISVIHSTRGIAIVCFAVFFELVTAAVFGNVILFSSEIFVAVIRIISCKILKMRSASSQRDLTFSLRYNWTGM